MNNISLSSPQELKNTIFAFICITSTGAAIGAATRIAISIINPQPLQKINDHARSVTSHTTTSSTNQILKVFFKAVNCSAISILETASAALDGAKWGSIIGATAGICYTSYN
ncbi:MAG: hypothetical protein K0S74_798 [Chlamydiales bacterium]|jgi:hypothetical protein|nr:hypothetical protein [Chlamydiales bacterium]